MSKRWNRSVPFVLVVFLTACASIGGGVSERAQGRQTAAGGIYKIGTPYQIEGEWYYPREDTSYTNTGIASWYGAKFDGKRTANGEIFDMRLLTAAHPTLPMPILAKVTNLENDKSVIVRINDRGPFKKNREIDLSKRAAEVLGFVTQGTASVRVEYLQRAPLYDAAGRPMRGAEPEVFITKKPPTPRDTKRIAAVPVDKVEAFALDGKPVSPVPQVSPAQKLYAVQVGAFGERANAENVRVALQSAFPNRSVEIEKAGNFYRVKTGGANIREDALAIRAQLIDAGYQDAIVLDQQLTTE